ARGAVLRGILGAALPEPPSGARHPGGALPVPPLSDVRVLAAGADRRAPLARHPAPPAPVPRRPLGADHADRGLDARAPDHDLAPPAAALPPAAAHGPVEARHPGRRVPASRPSIPPPRAGTSTCTRSRPAR